jgi:hypothetical protein
LAKENDEYAASDLIFTRKRSKPRDVRVRATPFSGQKHRGAHRIVVWEIFRACEITAGGGKRAESGDGRADFCHAGAHRRDAVTDLCAG